MVGASLATGLLLYLYQLSMGIMLPPAEYGVLASLTSILAVFLIFLQAITLAVARFTAAFTTGKGLAVANFVWHISLNRMLLVGVLAFGLFAAITPLLADFLKINSYQYCLIMFCSLIFAFPISANLGVMQGLQRFVHLGLSRFLIGLFRLVLGVALVYAGFGLEGGLVALPISFVLGLVITGYLLRDLKRFGSQQVSTTGFNSYIGFAMIGMLAIAGLTNLDVVLAKHYLSSDDAGVYSAVSVLGRIAFYAPAGVAVAMFPKVAKLHESGGNHRRLFWGAAGLTVAMVGSVCMIYGLFSHPITSLLFADEYASVADNLFLYSLGMSALSLANLAMTYFLALGKTRVIYPVLGALFVQIGLMTQFHANIFQIVHVMIICNVLALVLVGVFWLWTRSIGCPERKEQGHLLRNSVAMSRSN